MNKSSFFIVGQHAVIEALKNPNRKVLRVFLTEESKKNIHRCGTFFSAFVKNTLLTNL